MLVLGIDDGTYLIIHAGLKHLDRLLTKFTSPDDQSFLSLLRPSPLFIRNCFGAEADGRNKEQLENGTEHIIGGGHTRAIEAHCLHHEIGNHDLNQDGDNPGGQDPIHIVDPREAPDATVELEEEENDNAEDGVDWGNAVERGEIDRDITGRSKNAPHVVHRHAEGQGQIIGQIDSHDVKQQNPDISF